MLTGTDPRPPRAQSAQLLTGSREPRPPQRHTRRPGSGRFGWLSIPFILAALSLLTAGYISTFSPVQIMDGSRVIELRTHQTTIGALLHEANIELAPEDQVDPPLTSTLNANQLIVIKRAAPVVIRVDGQAPHRIRTQDNSASAILDQLGYKPDERDLLTVNGQSGDTLPPADPAGKPAEISLKHAAEITVQEENQPPVTFETTADTIGEALMQAGYTIFLADTVRPSPGELVKPGTHIYISRSKPVSILVDGRRIKTRTHRTLIRDVLSDIGVILYGEDYAHPAIETALGSDTEVHVIRVHHEVVVDQDVISFDTRWEADPELELDHEGMAQEGAPGVHERRTLVSYENGSEVKRELIADFVAREPQSKIYTYGTKVVVRTLDTPTGQVQYWRVIRMLATSYSANTAGVSLGTSYYGKVRCGFAMRFGIVAVDPRVIPLRTNVYVDGYGVGNACDTGSAIVGKRIDLGYDDSNLKLWYRWVDVYLLTPVPDVIKYEFGTP
jgi:resuscitation-promoting factor RpfB